MSHLTGWEHLKTCFSYLHCSISWCWLGCSCRDDSRSTQDGEDREGELLCLKIKTHLEDLFSDSHLAENGFLLKHLQRSRQGFVRSLQYIFIWFCVLYGVYIPTFWIKQAGEMQTKLRLPLFVTDKGADHRLVHDSSRSWVLRPSGGEWWMHLPEWLLCSPTSKLLFAWNFSEMQTEEDRAGRGPEYLSLSERVLQKLSAHGGVSEVWILHPGKELPTELQCYAKRNKELGQRGEVW